jgi:hypothetical protein
VEVCSTISHLHQAGILDTQPHKNPLYSEIFQPKPCIVMSDACAVLSWWWDKWSKQQATNNEWWLLVLMYSSCVPVRREEVIVACTAIIWVHMHLCTSYCSTHSAWCEEHHTSHIHPRYLMFLVWSSSYVWFCGICTKYVTSNIYMPVEKQLFLSLQLHIRYLHELLFWLHHFMTIVTCHKAWHPGYLTLSHKFVNTIAGGLRVYHQIPLQSVVWMHGWEHCGLVFHSSVCYVTWVVFKFVP